MTREEAIQELQNCKELIQQDGQDYLDERDFPLLDMAIEALQAEPTKVVPPSLADVYKWERDIALSQLEEYGIGFAEKKRDDLVEVVRCKDCVFYDYEMFPDDCRWDRDEVPDGDDFCSCGERKENVQAGEQLYTHEEVWGTGTERIRRIEVDDSHEE